jgi:hypothetical protein
MNPSGHDLCAGPFPAGAGRPCSHTIVPLGTTIRIECELSLTSDRSGGIDAVFLSAKSPLRQRKQEPDRQENELHRRDRSAAARDADDPWRQRRARRRLLDGDDRLPAAKNGVT